MGTTEADETHDAPGQREDDDVGSTIDHTKRAKARFSIIVPVIHAADRHVVKAVKSASDSPCFTLFAASLTGSKTIFID
jgi:hypothetical protein